MQLWLDIVKQEINITPFNEDDKKILKPGNIQT